MFKSICRLISVVPLLVGVAYAQPALTVATGVSKGTYSTMFKEMGSVCVNTNFLKERGTTGSLENIDLLLNNQSSLAFVQLDVLKAKEKIDKDPNISQIKVLLKLHNEEVHIITTAKPQGNLFKKIPILTYGDLKGKTVGAIGGAYVTAKVLSSYTGVKYNVTSFSTYVDALEALKQGKIQSLFAVGGYPVNLIRDLPSNTYKLVSMESVYTNKISSLYTPGTKVTYPNLGGSFTTVSVPSVLAVKNFKIPEKKTALLKYAECIRRNLIKLQDTEGYHAKWNSVTDSKVDWPYYK